MNRVKDTLMASDPGKYTREVNGKVIEDWRKINRDAKVLKKSLKGKIPSPEEAKKMLSASSQLIPPQLSIGKTSVHKNSCGIPMVLYGQRSVLHSPPQLGPILKGRKQSWKTVWHNPSQIYSCAMPLRQGFKTLPLSNPP